MLVRLCIAAGGICLALIWAYTAAAHTILPARFQEYLDAHPAATTEQIQSWIDEQNALLHSVVPAQAAALVADAGQDRGFFANAREFVTLGINHIFTGTDHILFLIATILTFASLKEIMKLTSAFTVAHSLTLILSGTLLITLSSRIVEPLIAFSIAYVAIVTVLLRRSEGRAKLATVFFFGLIHGMGFAGALKEVSIPANRFLSSLLFFNAGIEIGQLALISVFVPVLLLLRNTKWHYRLTRLAAAAISVIGIFWGIERLVG